MSAVYEDPAVLAEYLLFHYGESHEVLPDTRAWPQGMRDALDFAVRTPRHFSPGHAERGLDLGCAVGRSTFEMSRHCGHVTGIDFSHAFVGAADALRKGDVLEYLRKEEGHLATRLKASRPEGIDPERVSFLQADAMDLPQDLGAYDRVHAANLICRLTDPLRFFRRLPELVRPGGELVLATPCTWLEQFTAPDQWPAADTLGWLQDHLCAAFVLIRQDEEPFLIRETARKFQWTSSMLTVWKRQA